MKRSLANLIVATMQTLALGEMAVYAQNAATENTVQQATSNNLIDLTNVTNGGDTSASPAIDPAIETTEATPVKVTEALPVNPANNTATAEGLPEPAMNNAAAPVTASNAAVSEGAVPEATEAGSDIPTAQAEASMTDEGAATDSDMQIVRSNDFSGTPFFPGTRRNVASGEAPEIYKVQEGDTLFDICDQLIDEPDYWPKLWALNPGIKNPHFIFPGVELSFYPGDEEVPPYIQVVAEADTVPVEKGEVEASELTNVDISGLLFAVDKDEAALRISKPVVAMEIIDSDAIPGSFGEDFEEIGRVYDTSTGTVTMPAFLFEDEVEPLGTIVGGPIGSFLVGAGDKVVVYSEEGLNPSTTYTVVRPSGEIASLVGSDFSAHRYEFVGHINIERTLGDNSYKLGSDTYTRLGLQPGDMVIDYTSTTRGYSMRAAPPNMSAPNGSVIGFAYPDQIMAGQGDLVFLEGSFQAGSVLGIYEYINSRSSKHMGVDLPEIQEPVGVVQVIDRLKVGSVGIITSNTLDIRLGDQLGRL